MTTILIISAYVLIVVMIFFNIKRFKENRSLSSQNDLIESDYQSLLKKYNFVLELNKKNTDAISELQKKSNKYDKELERCRIKSAKLRAKKQQSKN